MVITVFIIIGIKTGKVPFPKFTINSINAFGGLIKPLFRLFGLDEKNVTKIEVDIKNKLNRKAFMQTKPNERLLLLPQCLRSQKCPATLSSTEGIKCIECGACVIKKIKEKAKKLGMKTIIVPGGTFAARMIKKHKPKAVIGVGCLFEIQEGLNMCEKYGVPAQGVVLLKDGCVDTKVDLEELFEVMEAGVAQPG